MGDFWWSYTGRKHLSEAYIQVYSLFTDFFSDESCLGTCSFPFWSLLPRLSPSELRLHCDSVLGLRKVSVQMQDTGVFGFVETEWSQNRASWSKGHGWSWGCGVWKRRSGGIVWFLIFTLVIGILSECLPAYCFCLWEMFVALFIGTHRELCWMGGPYDGISTIKK